MKFAQVATALLGVTSAMHKAEESDERLSQLITSALAGAPPGIITEPDNAKLKGAEGDKTVTVGQTKNYKFHWQYVCAFTKWTPTNQWLHA